VINDLPFKYGDEVAILINGLGATPTEELFILNNKIHDILIGNGIKIYKTYVGDGASLSLLKLNDEFKKLVNAPAFSPFLLQWK
jgi:dihydroxyacetone kinase-like protein